MSRQGAVQENQVQGRRRNDQAPETRRNHLSTRNSESRKGRRNPLFAKHEPELDEEQFFNQLPTLRDVLQAIDPEAVIPESPFILDSTDNIQNAMFTGKSERFIEFEELYPKEERLPGYPENLRKRTVRVRELYKTHGGVNFWKTYQEYEYSVVVTNTASITYEVVKPGTLKRFANHFI